MWMRHPVKRAYPPKLIRQACATKIIQTDGKMDHSRFKRGKTDETPRRTKVA